MEAVALGLAAANDRPLLDWFERHGIDPGDVVLPGWVEVNPEARTIRWLGLHGGPSNIHRHGACLNPAFPSKTTGACHEIHCLQVAPEPLPPVPAEWDPETVDPTKRDQSRNDEGGR